MRKGWEIDWLYNLKNKAECLYNHVKQNATAIALEILDTRIEIKTTVNTSKIERFLIEFKKRKKIF